MGVGGGGGAWIPQGGGAMVSCPPSPSPPGQLRPRPPRQAILAQTGKDSQAEEWKKGLKGNLGLRASCPPTTQLTE